MVKCSVKYCLRNANTDMGISFFRFPAESARCDEWMRALGRPDLQGVNAERLHQAKYRVCGVHFHSSSFSSMLMNRLKKDAIPVNFPAAAKPGPYFEEELNEVEKYTTGICLECTIWQRRIQLYRKEKNFKCVSLLGKTEIAILRSG